MKNRMAEDGSSREKFKVWESMNQKSKKTKKNKMRMGGKGLSLEAFANAKTKTDHYNPSIIKKQREFYKNAKYVRKYKKSQKHENGQIDPSAAVRPLKNDNESVQAGDFTQARKKHRRDSARSLKEIYEKKREEQEKARIEREASLRAKEEEIERAQSRRKAFREKMLKRTMSGQPVMKYRIEHILETIQGSKS